MAVTIFFLGFIALFCGFQMWLAFKIFWMLASFLIIGLSSISNIFTKIFGKPRKSKDQKISERFGTTVSLEDPVGALCIISEKYSDVIFLKDILFLELELYGQGEGRLAVLYHQAELDPRAVVASMCGCKMMIELSKKRFVLKRSGQWTEEQEEIWIRKTPKEFRSVLNKHSA